MIPTTSKIRTRTKVIQNPHAEDKQSPATLFRASCNMLPSKSKENEALLKMIASAQKPEYLQDLKTVITNVQDRMCRGGGYITVPERFARTFAEVQPGDTTSLKTKLELICAHSNSYFGFDNYRTQITGTTFTNTAKSLIQTIDGMLKPKLTTALLTQHFGQPTSVFHQYTKSELDADDSQQTKSVSSHSTASLMNMHGVIN